MNKLEILRKCELFCELNDEQLGTVEKLCTVEMFEPGTTICKQDKGLEKIFVIEDGLAGIILEVGPLSQRQVQSAGKFDILGWSAVMETDAGTATVKALEKTSVLAFNGRELRNLCSANPEFGLVVYRGLLRVLRKRLRESYTQLLGVTHEA